MKKLVSLLIETSIRFRVTVVLIIGALTAMFMVLASQLPLKTIFDDLLPADHPYIQVHQKHKATFGSSNLVLSLIHI